MNRRRGNDKTIKEAIDQLLDVYKLRRKFDETALLAAWPKLMGPSIARRTRKIYVYDKKLFLKVESAVIKNELLLIKSNIVDRLNAHVGQEVVREIVFL